MIAMYMRTRGAICNIQAQETSLQGSKLHSALLKVDVAAYAGCVDLVRVCELAAANNGMRV